MTKHNPLKKGITIKSFFKLILNDDGPKLLPTKRRVGPEENNLTTSAFAYTPQASEMPPVPSQCNSVQTHLSSRHQLLTYMKTRK